MQEVAVLGVAELYARHRVELVRLAHLLVRDLPTAEDVVQDAFAGLHRHRNGVREPDKALHYLRRSVVNNSRSALRRRRTASAYVPPREPGPDTPEDQALAWAERRRVMDALGGLSPRQREVLVLRYWSDFSEAEIADCLGIARGTVKATASHALQALRARMEAQR